MRPFLFAGAMALVGCQPAPPRIVVDTADYSQPMLNFDVTIAGAPRDRLVVLAGTAARDLIARWQAAPSAYPDDLDGFNLTFRAADSGEPFAHMTFMIDDLTGDEIAIRSPVKALDYASDIGFWTAANLDLAIEHCASANVREVSPYFCALVDEEAL